MSTLIVYMTHHGTTRKVVERLAEGFGTDRTTVVNLEKNHFPDLTDFQTIIIGGSIHMGQIQTGVKRFCEANKDQLLTKQLGLFLCFMNLDLGQEEFNNAYPKELRDYAKAHGLFGGELLFDKMNFIEKFIVKMVSMESGYRSELDYSAMDKFIQEFK